MPLQPQVLWMLRLEEITRVHEFKANLGKTGSPLSKTTNQRRFKHYQ